MDAQAKLLEVIAAAHPASRLSSGLNRWQQQTN
jgi:hypothetical protein